MKPLSIILIIVMYALFGSIFTIGKMAVAVCSPYFFTSIRMLLAGLILLIYLALDKQRLVLPKKCWPLIFLVAFFNVFITNAFEFWGLQYMSAGKTCLIYSLSPFAAALIAFFFNTEKMTTRKWLALIVGISSFVPLMAAPWFKGNERGDMEIWAEGALIISAITAVIGWTFVKKLTTRYHISHVLVNGMSFLLAGIFSLVTSLLVETWNPIPVINGQIFGITLLYVVVIHNIICYSIYAESLKQFSVTFMAFMGLFNPFFASLCGWIFLNEEINLPFITAFCGVCTGLYLFYCEEKKKISICTNIYTQ